MTEEEFAETFGGLVQGSPWAVERAFEQRPFADTLALRAAFQDALLTGNTQEQQELIKSYPDLGSENEIGLDSAQDHAMAGLSNLDEDERAEVVRDRRGVQAEVRLPVHRLRAGDRQLPEGRRSRLGPDGQLADRSSTPPH